MNRLAAATVGWIIIGLMFSTLGFGTTAPAVGAEYEGLIPSFDGDRKLGPPPSASSQQSTVGKMFSAMHPKHAFNFTKSTFRKLNSSTKRMVGHLTPWKRDTPKRAERLAKNERQKKTSFLPSWFRQEEPKAPPPTLSEWIGRPKP